jgi:hypothetical protein
MYVAGIFLPSLVCCYVFVTNSMVSELVSICCPDTSCIWGCDQPLMIAVFNGNKENTDNARLSILAKAAWLSAAATTAVSSKRTFIRFVLAPILAGVK